MALNYSIVAGNNATLNNATLSFNDSGQLTVEITQQGNNLYNQAVPVRVVFVVGQGNTSLSNFTIPTKTNLDNDFNLAFKLVFFDENDEEVEPAQYKALSTFSVEREMSIQQ